MGSILLMQDAIAKLGWQWEEHIYNDGLGVGNCSIKFSLSTDPCYFINHVIGDCGWGRFERHHAWSQAYQRLVVDGIRYEPKEDEEPKDD